MRDFTCGLENAKLLNYLLLSENFRESQLEVGNRDRKEAKCSYLASVIYGG